MSNDFTKVYQFLSSYGSDNAWVKAADTNEDNDVSKREFVDFVNKDYSKWNGNESGETLSADIINKFWTEINNTVHGTQSSSKANKNNLDEKEQEALNKKLEAYVALNDFIKTNVSIPSVLTTTGAQWKAAVSDELSAILEKNASKGADALKEIWKEKLPEIENKQTALFCATEYQNTLVNGILKDYPDYKVADDPTLNKLIDEYLKKLGQQNSTAEISNGLIVNPSVRFPNLANAGFFMPVQLTITPLTIQENIQAIIDAYLKTAGLGEGSDYDLSTLGYTQNENSALNGIQQSVVKTTLLNTLNAGKASDSLATSYPEYYDKAIEDFISTKLSGARFKDIESLKALKVEDFKGSKSYKMITALSNFDNQYANAASTNNWENGIFHQAVAEALGNAKDKNDSSKYTSTNLSKSLVEDWKDIPAMKEIMTLVKQGILDGTFMDENGNLKAEEMKEFIIKKIQENLATILSQVYDGSSNSDITPDEIKNIYNTQVTTADKIEDDAKRLEQYKNAALTYCQSITGRSEGYKKELAGFEDRIKNAQSVMAIKNIMKEAIAAIDKIKEAEEKKIAESKTEAENAKTTETALEDLNSKEKKDEVHKYITDTIKPGYSDVTYYVNDKGEIVFVDYDVKGGAFNDSKDATLQEKFNKLKTQLETTYKTVTDALGLGDNEKKNLFNIALYLTLSDTTIVRSMYESQNITNIMDAVLENYTKLLSKAGTDEKTKDYIKNYPAGSILAGTTTYTGKRDSNHNTDNARTLNKYYLDDSTKGSDDWVSISSRGSETFTNGQYSGAIITLTSGTSGDNDPVNNAMKSMLKDYIVSYSKYIDGNKIIELFRRAQETAFSNLEATINQTDPSGSSIYGYGESEGGKKDNADTYKTNFYGANSILINVAYEMEKLIAREMAGLN